MTVLTREADIESLDLTTCYRALSIKNYSFPLTNAFTGRFIRVTAVGDTC